MSVSAAKQATRRRMITVSSQLAAVVAIGISIGFLMVIGMQIERSRSLLYDVELHRNLHTTELIASNLYGPVRWRKPEVIQESYKRMVSHEDLGISAAIALDRQGELLTAYEKDPSISLDLQAVLRSHVLPEVNKPEATTINNHYVVVAPVLSQNGLDRAGTFAIAWNLKELDEMAAALILQQGGTALATLGIFVTTALVFVHRRLGKPLAQITEATDRIANGDKNFDVPFTQRQDEIGNMARSLVTFRQNVALIDRLTADQQQQNQRLATALAKEKEYNSLHREFVAMVSHEFRTPVAIIDGAAQRIERRIGKDTPERLLERTNKIRSAVARMIDLIDSTLSVSRMEAGTIELSPAECDLGALLRDICQRQQDIAKKHEINLTIADLPAKTIIDPQRMDQIFTNLLSNAVKYAPNSPRIDVKAGTVGQNVVVSIRDFGLGIPKDELPKLFEKFFRASTSTGIPGTGIGLHLVKHLIELHDGTITVDSTEGKGTTFSITFPATPASGESTQEKSEPPAAAALSA